MSSLASSKKWEEFNDMVIQAVKIIIVIALPVTFYSLVTGREMITLLFKKAMFDDQSVELTLGEFRFHIAGLVFIAMNRILCPAFYAQGNSKLPATAGIICFATNILLVFILVKPFSGNGIACALSIASFINTVFLFIFMKKKKFLIENLCNITIDKNSIRVACARIDHYTTYFFTCQVKKMHKKSRIFVNFSQKSCRIV